MKKYLKIIIPILFIGVLGYFGYQIYIKIQHKKEVAENIKTIPRFAYKSMDGKTFTNKNLKTGKPIVFFYFNSDCEHCQNEAQQVRLNLSKLSGVELIFISFETPKSIKNFARTYQLDDCKNITFLCDQKITFATTFDVNAVPSIVTYDKNQKLVEKIKGQVKIETLIKKLK